MTSRTPMDIEQVARPDAPPVRGLQRKLLMPLLAVGLILSAIAVWDTVRGIDARSLARLHREATHIGDAVNHAVATVSSVKELTRFVAAMGAEREVRQIVVAIGDPLQVVAATRNAWTGRLLVTLPELLAGLPDVRQVLLKGQDTCREVTQTQEVVCVLTTAMPHRDAVSRAGVIVVRMDAREVVSASRWLAMRQSALMLLLVACICALAAALLHVHVLRPVRAMTRMTERRQAGEASTVGAGQTGDELGVLGRKLDESNARGDRDLLDLTQRKHSIEALSRQLEIRARKSAVQAEVSSLCHHSALDEAELLRSVVGMLPAGWQHASLAAARITLDGQQFMSDGFEATAWMQSAVIEVRGVSIGRVDVVYVRRPPGDGENVFLREERDLIDAVAGAIGETIRRRRGERALAESKGLLEGLGQSQALFISGKAATEVFDQLLANLLQVTRSEYGFIGEVLRKPDGVPYLRAFALTNIAWNDETRNFYKQHVPRGLEFHNLNSLFGAVMTSESLVIANKPASDPRSTGIPPGHPPLNAFMGVPIHAGGDLVGMIGVANRPDGYEPALARFLDPLLVTCGNMIVASRNDKRRVEAEAELRRHRDHLNDLVLEQTADIRAAKEEAERANRAKSEFLANMSHELRTPMHAVMSFAQLGVDRAATLDRDKLAHYFSNVLKSAQRLLGLLNDLLDLSKLEAGKMHLDLEMRDLAEVARDAVMESSALAQSRKIELVLEERGDPVRVQCDPLRILQVVRNLVSNAIKFSPEGSVVRLRVSPCAMHAGRRAQDAGQIPGGRIDVIDRGIGIPEEELEAIFQKFVQSSKTKSGAGGTGLGLAICREIMRAHQGEIRAANNHGGGATFTIVVPAAQETAAFPIVALPQPSEVVSDR